jgi:hypothetical protein
LPLNPQIMLLSMICWGFWANAIKLTPGWPVQLFYWDYVAGILLASVAWGLPRRLPWGASPGSYSQPLPERQSPSSACRGRRRHLQCGQPRPIQKNTSTIPSTGFCIAMAEFRNTGDIALKR